MSILSTSSVRRIEFECPFCGGKSDTTLQLRIDLQKEPAALSRLFEGKLTEIACSKCGGSAVFDYSVELTDSENKLIFWLDPPNDPFSLKLNEGLCKADYRYRRVADSNTLREVVSVFRDNLDDGAMLLLKHLVAARILKDSGHSPLICNYEGLAGEATDAWLEFIIFTTEEGDPESVTVPLSMYIGIVGQISEIENVVMPVGNWVDWNDQTAERLWMSIPRESAIS